MDDQQRGILQRALTQEMKKSFLEYSMSVIVARALPDVRDGLKPVQRRIVYGMNELGAHSDKPYKKSARIVGDVMGKYHPHGDSSIYEALVRMAQDFSYRYMLVDGHGNFGDIDGDGAAAQRYTEARMSKLSMELVKDINKNTIDFIPNYDGEDQEPVVLPSRFPNLLVNGTTGIAVGMATNMPPHNIGEAIDACLAVAHNPDITIPELMETALPGPDFPTGAYILGKSGIRKAYETGNGLIIMRARTEIEEKANGKKTIIVTEIPYMVNKARLIEKMAEHVREKRIDGITEIRDESNREGIRIVIELRRDVQAEVILNQLYKLTALQTSFGCNMIALVNNEPKTLSIKEIIQYYLEHQEEVIKRRTEFELKKAKERAHILEGLKVALDNIDAIIALIRSSRTTQIIQQRLMDEFGLSDKQATAIREMQLQRLAGLEREKILNELEQLLITIADLEDIISSRERILEIVEKELLEIKEKYNDKRRTEIIQGSFDLEDADLIPEENSIITLSKNGYIKRLPVDTYKAQNRGGKGIKGSSSADEEISHMINMSSHDDLLFFTNFGKVYRIKGYQVPEFGRTSKGLAVVNIIDLDKEEKIMSLIALDPEFIAKAENEQYLFFTTKQGIVKRVNINEFENIRQSGKIAITLKEGDELISVKLTDGHSEVLIGAKNGKLIRFSEEDVRPMSRVAAGVKGMDVTNTEVVGVATTFDGDKLLVVTEKGYGKITSIDEYRKSFRGGKGVKTVNITAKNGELVSIQTINDKQDLLIMTTEGIIIRLPVAQISISGRNTQGVRLIRVSDQYKVCTVALLYHIEGEDAEDSITLEEVNEAE